MRLRDVVPGPDGHGPRDRPSGARGVSPVVAVVLLLGITMLLAAIAGPFVFGVIDDFGSDTPNTEFSFHYEQGVPSSLDSSTDDFGTPFDQGDGVVTIQLQKGDNLDPGNVELRSRLSGGNLLTDTADDVFAPGETVREGAVLRVAVERDETLFLVWTADSGGESAIIGEFPIDVPATSATPQVPDADRGCEYIEEQLEDGENDNDVEVTGVVVECDLDQYYPRITDITIQSENGDFGAIIGEVNGTGDVNLIDGGTFQGNIETGADGDDGDVDLVQGSVVYGNIITKGDGDVTATERSKVEGGVTATGAVNVQSDSSVAADIVSGTDGSGGDVDVKSGRVGGSIRAVGDGDITVDEGSNVLGGANATGAVDVLGDSAVGGDIVSGTDGSDGDVQIKSSDIDGDITAKGDGSVDVDEQSTVNGDITSSAGVDVQTNSEIDGKVVSGTAGSSGDIQISSSEVGGPITAQSSGKIDIYGQSTVDGAITANDGVVQVSGQSSVDSPITANGNGGVIIQGTSTVDGGLTVESTNDITVEGTSQVSGSITANGSGNLNIKGSSTVEGGITANVSGNFNIQSSSTVGGPLETDRCAGVSGGSSVAGDILMGASATASNQCTTTVSSSNVGGAVVAQGAANLDVSDSVIQGQFSPEPDSTLTCSNSIINGQNCSTVKQPALALNITSIDSSVSKGDTLNVDLTVENIGFGGKTDLPMLVNGTEELVKQDIDLARNEVDNGIQFQWDTSSTSPGTYNLTIASDVESENRTVYIAGSSSPAWEVKSVDSADDVLAGKNLSVSTKIRNNGQSQGTTTVELLDFDGQTVDTKDVTVQDDASKEITLEWNTSSDDRGTGNFTVDTVNQSRTGGVEVLNNVYKLEDVALYESGKDLDVELFLNLSNDATADIEVFDKNGDSLETTTVDAASDVYTVLKNDNVNSFKGEVTVTLYDRDGDKRGEKTVNWNG